MPAVASSSTDMRVRFPLWLRMALAFGGVTGLFLLLWGGLDLRRDAAERAVQHEARMVGLAQTLAGGLDGAALARFRRTADMTLPEYAAMTEQLRLARDANGLSWVGSSARDERGRFYAVLDGGSPPPLPVGYPIFDGLALRTRVYQGEAVYTPELVDEWGVWSVAMAPIRDDAGQVVGAVEVMEDAAWRSLEARGVLLRALAQTAAVVLLLAGVAMLLARQLSRPLRELTAAAHAVAAGDLEQEVQTRAHDEIGVLAAAFRRMVAGLREREQIRQTFGRFVSEEVAAHALEDGGTDLVGEARVVTILFSDLRGFSGLSRERSPTETLTLLNRYLAAMTDVILAHHGNLSELMGDGLLVLFGAPTHREDDAVRAVQCALEMQRALAALNATAGLRLEMGVGIATGEVVAGNIGSERRLKYGVVGAPVNLAARLEGFALGSQVLISEATLAATGDAVEVGPRQEVRAKGWDRPVACYTVLTANGVEAIEDTSVLSWRTVELAARCRFVHEKTISPVDHGVRIVAVSRRALILSARFPLALRTQIVLDIDGDPAIPEVYGVVSEVEGEGLVSVRILALPDASRARLLRLVDPEDGGEA